MATLRCTRRSTAGFAVCCPRVNSNVMRHTQASSPRGRRLDVLPLEFAMSTLVEELSARAKTLPPEDRARLAEELLDSLQETSDADADAAWEREIERRVAEIESGAVKLIPAEDVHAEARRLIRR